VIKDNLNREYAAQSKIDREQQNFILCEQLSKGLGGTLNKLMVSRGCQYNMHLYLK
jgi:hypothetical protein